MTAFRQSEAWLAARRAESEARKRAADGLKRPESDPKPVQALVASPRTFGAGMVAFTVPGAPVPKARPRLGRDHVYTPRKTINAEAVVRSVAQLAGCVPIVGPIVLELDFFLPIPKAWNKTKTQAALLGALRPAGRPDGDNLAKLVLDGLNGTAFVDDAQIVELTCRKWYGEPRTEVRIVPLP